MTSFRAIAILAFVSLLAVPSPGISAKVGQEPIFIPRGGVLTLELLPTINSNTNKKGDQFNCKVVEPAHLANAIVTGQIQYIKASGKAKKASEIAVSLESITIG